MPEWLASRLPAGWHGWHVMVFTVAFATASAVVSLFAVGYALARLPCDYFVNPAARARQHRRHLALHVLVVAGRNLLGYALIALGVVLSLPGVPGQGVLTILMGVMLIDVPGKRRVERWLVSRPPVAAAVNKLRAKFGCEPLITDADARPGPAPAPPPGAPLTDAGTVR